MRQGILSFQKKLSWRIIFLLAASPIFLNACFSGQNESRSEKGKGGHAGMDTSRISHLIVPTNAAFCSVLDDLDKSDLQNINRALTVFSANSADSLGRDSMLISFNEFMTSAMQGYYDSKLIGNQEVIEHFRNKDEQAEAQKLTASLATHGINISYRDGDFYLEPNLEFIYERVNKVITESSRDYLQTKINISKGFTTADGQPVSAPDSLAFQVIAWDNFMTKNPEYLMKDEIQAQYFDVLASYLSGTEQFPLYDPNTKILDPKYHSSYLRYIEDYPDRESTKIIKKFYDLLASKGFKYDESMDSFLPDVSANLAKNQQ
jgi:hypothetical protein